MFYNVSVSYRDGNYLIIPTGRKKVKSMRVKVVGMKRFDGEVEGREYHQTTLYCIEKDFIQDGLVISIFIISRFGRVMMLFSFAIM